jgi:hypothetical protein
VASRTSHSIAIAAKQLKFQQFGYSAGVLSASGPNQAAREPVEHPPNLGRATLRTALAVPAIASAIYVCHVAVPFVLIPPWQQPDEPSHVALVELHRNRVDLLDGSLDPARESEILKSMARYDFWYHRAPGFAIPSEIPDRFLAAGPRVAVDVVEIARPTIYFRVAGRLLRWFPRLSVVEDLYLLRGLAAIFGLLTIWAAWLAARESLGEGGAIVPVLLALHPQFVTVSAAATPDAMANLLGAFMWWQTAVVVRTGFLLPLAGVWAAALAAASADRMGVPLLAVALLVSLVVVRRRMPQPIVKTSLARTAAVVAIVFAMSVWIIDTFGNTYNVRGMVFRSWMPVPDALRWDFFQGFTSFVHQSWWFSLGWVRYGPPSWWVAACVALTAIALIGAYRRIAGRGDDPATRTILLLAAAAVALQLFAVYMTYFRLGNGAQGKSLFPVLIPCLLLLSAGVEGLVPRARLLHVAAALVLVFALLDAAAWGLVAIPAYYASL